MQGYLEISISSTEAQRELLIPAMIELGCHGFQETDTELLCYIHRGRWPAAGDALPESFARLLRSFSSNAAIRFREVPDENWNARWEESVAPVRAGNRFVVKPSWRDFEPGEGDIVIRIDPKMSFGTGHHETTRLTLRLLEAHIAPGMRMLDVGTGTGILAIASVLLGARSALGIDTDPWSILNAGENVAANNVQDSVRISSAPLGELEERDFDLITANLTLNTNLELLDEYRTRLRTRGVLLLSGLLLQDGDAMRDGLVRKGFAVAETVQEGEWIAIAALKE